MENNPSEPPLSDQFEKWLEKQAARERLADRLLQAYQMGARIKFDAALNIRAAIVTSPERAQALYERQQALYRAPEIAVAIVKACDTDSTDLKKLWNDISHNGALLEQKTVQTYEERLRRPQQWVIAEASGTHPAFHSPLFGIDKTVADCQCLLPEDHDGAAPVIPLLDPRKDLIYNPELYERIKKALPAQVGLIDQIAVDPEFAHLRLAAEARFKALTEVYHLERKHPVEHMVGLAFCIQGLKLDSGEEFHLDRVGLKSLSNMISLFVNEHSTRCPATIVGRLRRADVPVKFSYEGRDMSGALMTDWYYLDHVMDELVS